MGSRGAVGSDSRVISAASAFMTAILPDLVQPQPQPHRPNHCKILLLKANELTYCFSNEILEIHIS
jgi:hypothetical protein